MGPRSSPAPLRGGISNPHILDDFTILEMNTAINPIKQPVIVGRKNKGGTAILIDLSHQIDNQICVPRIKIGGWFVGDDECRIGHESAGNGDALLLSPAHFLGAVIHPVAQLNLDEKSLGAKRRLLFSKRRKAGAANITFSRAVSTGIRLKF